MTGDAGLTGTMVANRDVQVRANKPQSEVYASFSMKHSVGN